MAEGETPEVDLEALQEQLAALSVDDFVLSAASTIASLAFAKLERRDLGQAKKAIDVLAALVPHLEGAPAGDLRNALTQLQVAYAGAVSP